MDDLELPEDCLCIFNAGFQAICLGSSFWSNPEFNASEFETYATLVAKEGVRLGEKYLSDSPGVEDKRKFAKACLEVAFKIVNGEIKP